MNENKTLPSSEYSVVEWLGYELRILHPGIDYASYHIAFIFLLEIATKFFSLKNWTAVQGNLMTRNVI